MIELRWIRPEPSYYDGFIPSHAVRLNNGLAVVLQYRESEPSTFVGEDYVHGEWVDVPIEDES